MIYILRHGQTDWNIEGKTQGQTDIPLNETGRMQARMAAETIKDLKIDRIISSDLSRAKETASIINKEFNKPIVYDKRISEICFGKLEGLPREQVNDALINTFDYEPEKINAETKQHVYNRVKNFFEELKQTKENTLIVTHGGTIRMIMYYVNHPDYFSTELYFKEFQDMKISNADIFEIDDQYKLKRYNV